jgi:hypothetical protein
MIFPRTLPTGRYGWAAFAPYLAHEFMHMIQYSYNLSSGNLGSSENLWLKEGTAQWVQDYISEEEYGIRVPPKQTEQLPLDLFFDNPEKSLDSTAPNHHDYASYIFWLWAVRKANDPSMVRQVWNAVGTQKSLNAAKSLFGSGWDQAWKEFTQANWNQDPVTDYKGWDSITNTPKVESETTLPSNTLTPVITSVAPVAARYFTFKPASDTNTLTYKNIGGLADSAGIQAIFTYDDDSHGIEDWTQVAQEDVPFCNVKSLTLVLSNSSTTAGDNRSFSLTFSPPGPGPHAGITPRAANVCVPEPQGSFSGTGDYDNGVGTTLHYSWSGTADFDPFGPGNPWFPDYSSEIWDSATVVSGSVTLSGSGESVGSDETCTLDLPANTYEFGTGDGTMMIQPGPEPHYGIDLNFPANQLPDLTIDCPESGSSTIPFTPPGHLVYTAEPEQTSVRGTYAGSATLGDGAHLSESYTWNFTDPTPTP